MTNIIVVLSKLEEAKALKTVLVRNGFRVTGVCSTGSQAINQADDLQDGIVICSHKLPDMVYDELQECLPAGFEMLLLASPKYINECYGNNLVCLSMPLKVNDLVNTLNMMMEGIARRRKRLKSQPKIRNEKEEQLIKEAKDLLITRNHMTEDEAHKYLQKCSMDSGTNIVETAQMVLTMMKV